MAQKTEGLLETILKEKLEAKFIEEIESLISDEDIKKVCTKCLTPEALEYSVKEWAENRFENIFDESYFEMMVHKNKQFYEAKVKEIFDNMLTQPKIQEIISKSIMENYINDISDTCVFQEMFENVAKNYKIVFVPIEQPAKKIKKKQ